MTLSYTQYRVEAYRRYFLGSEGWDEQPDATYLSLERLREDWAPDVDTNPDLRIVTRTVTDWEIFPK